MSKPTTAPLFLDLECLPGPTPPPIDEIEAPSNYKDPEKIAAYKLEAQQELWHKQATVSYKGRIVCAAWALGDAEPTVVSGDEKDVTGKLYAAMQMAYHYIGHNVTFDLLFSAHSGIRHGFAIGKLLEQKSKWEKNWTCTMELASFGLEWKYKVSLENLCVLCGVDKPFGKGADVFDWHNEGRMDLIEKHCLSDLIAMRACYFKLAS